jgi:hypothetical protein
MLCHRDASSTLPKARSPLFLDHSIVNANYNLGALFVSPLKRQMAESKWEAIAQSKRVLGVAETACVLVVADELLTGGETTLANAVALSAFLAKPPSDGSAAGIWLCASPSQLVCVADVLCIVDQRIVSVVVCASRLLFERTRESE